MVPDKYNKRDIDQPNDMLHHLLQKLDYIQGREASALLLVPMACYGLLRAVGMLWNHQFVGLHGVNS
ncbi:hypothetical protein TNCT_86091 [Trichonephila clavata]|uniref:Uncharacterized protein n=1 Tax=Trichonephila clavata TaxID=2740835 RepID=A0A8X6GLN7_TRICU|nr:hypothetical protein TNCT_86091 [Trichonephila clavata]